MAQRWTPSRTGKKGRRDNIDRDTSCPPPLPPPLRRASNFTCTLLRNEDHRHMLHVRLFLEWNRSNVTTMRREILYSISRKINFTRSNFSSFSRSSEYYSRGKWVNFFEFSKKEEEEETESKWTNEWINFIPNYKPSSKFVKSIFLRYIHIHSKTHDLFYASPFSNNNQRTNWHLRFPSTTQLRAVSSPFTPVAKCAPLPTSRRWSSIALKRRRYTNAYNSVWMKPWKARNREN